MSASQTHSFDREYQALRTGPAMVGLANWSSVRVTGPDRLTFLHNFCTNDVKRLVPGASCEAFFTNVKGKIVGHGMISCRSDELVIVGAPGQAARIIEHLERYIIREDVQLADDTAARNYVLISNCATDRQGAISWDLVGNGAGTILEGTSEEADALQSDLAKQGCVTIREQVFEAARIESGFPLFGIDFSEENLPQEVGRDHEAISFTKGCYLGQETVARIDAMGHVNQKIAGFRFFGSEVPECGTEITLQGRVVGGVTSTTFSPKFGGPLALGMLRREANSPGTQLQSRFGDCEVIGL